MNPDVGRPALQLLQGGRGGDWAAKQTSWLSDIPSGSALQDPHVPNLTDMPVRFDEGPPWRSKLYHAPSWYQGGDKRRVRLLRKYVKEYGRDPRMRAFVLKHVLQGSLFPSRQFEAQARAILQWVQSNIAYVNEPGELIQSPWHTLKVAAGDCDDLGLLVAAMAESVALGNRFVLGGRRAGGRGPACRWAEGKGSPPSDAKFFHIFVDLGWPALKPTTWKAAEPTMQVPLGWDVTKQGVPAGVARGVDVSLSGALSGPGSFMAMGTASPLGISLPAAEDVAKYSKDVVKLAIVGAVAQIFLLLFMRSRFGSRLKRWAGGKR